MRKLFLLLITALMLFPSNAVLADDSVRVTLPITVEGGEQTITVYNGENIIFSETLSGESEISFTLPPEPENYKFLIKGISGDDDKLIYDESLYDFFVSIVYEDGVLSPKMAVAQHNSDLKINQVKYEIETKTPDDFPIKLLKVDKNGTPLPGAHFQITSEDGYEGEYISSDSEKTLYLKPGTYTFKETKAPNKYSSVPEFTLTIDENGVITMAENEYLIYNEGELTLKIINPKKVSSVLVTHKVRSTGEILKDVEYVLMDEELDTPYSTGPLTFEGYEYVCLEDGSDPESGINEDRVQHVIFLYDPVEEPEPEVKKGSVIVTYIDTEGNVLIEAEYLLKEVEVGTDYKSVRKEIDGYEFVKLADNSVLPEGKIIEGEQLIIYVFRKKVTPTPPTPQPPTPTPTPQQQTPTNDRVNTGFGQNTALYIGGISIALIAVIGLIIYLKKSNSKDSK